MDVFDQALDYIKTSNNHKLFESEVSSDSPNGRYILYRGQKVLYISPTQFVCLTIQNADRFRLEYEMKKFNHPFKAKLNSKYYNDIGKILDMVVGLHNQ